MITFTKPYKKAHETWMDIILEDDTYPVCYLTDIANDMIDGALVMLRERLPFVLEADADGKHYMFASGRLLRKFIVTDGVTMKSYPMMDPLQLARCIYVFLDENREAYYEWFSYEDDEEEIAQYKEKLDKGLEKLKTAIENYNK